MGAFSRIRFEDAPLPLGSWAGSQVAGDSSIRPPQVAWGERQKPPFDASGDSGGIFRKT